MCKSTVDTSTLECKCNEGVNPAAFAGYASVAEFVPVTEALPLTGIDVIGMNINSSQMEFGFRSNKDKHISRWLDFSFPVTHWAYYKIKA